MIILHGFYELNCITFRNFYWERSCICYTTYFMYFLTYYHIVVIIFNRFIDRFLGFYEVLEFNNFLLIAIKSTVN